MNARNILLSLLLMVAGMQSASAQGFRVYKSDGTVVQFSFRTDSIVFYDGIGSDAEFGPFTPVNQMIVGTWYKSKTESVSFNEDGTTDYISGGTYQFLPYQGNIIIGNASGAPMKILKVYGMTSEQMLVGTPGSESFSIWSSTRPIQLVTSITLSETSITIYEGLRKRLTPTILPDDAENKVVNWRSSDEKVAKVQNGIVSAGSAGVCVITVSATDGSGVEAACEVTVISESDEHEWVDLGLPSGTKWATCNVGASSPEEYGDYFAWGEIEPKDTYDWSTYKWCRGSNNTMTKYCNESYSGYNGFTDDLIELKPEDDAATANWGSGWQMPSWDQLKELCNSSYTTTEWTQENGVNGRRVTSNVNGNSIFMPAAGYRDARGHHNGDWGGYYWTRRNVLGETVQSWELFFYSLNFGWGSDERFLGKSVRPVRK